MLWILHVMLGAQEWGWEDEDPRTIQFDDEAWDIIIKECHENGINAILLDVGEGVQYPSHPELARPGSWPVERVHKEVKRLKELGIALIPFVNFSATHHHWLGDYAKMMSTEPYYKVCRELIQDTYEMFGKPPYIMLGMDEEDNTFCLRNMKGLVSMRRGKLFWHDLQFLCDCVRETGASPWIAADHLIKFPEEFRKNVSTEDITLIPWHYMAVKKEHYSRIDSLPMYKEFYSQEPLCYMNLTYVEDDAYFVNFMKQVKPGAEYGYNMIPMVSTYNKCEYCTDDHMDYFWNNIPRERFKGFSTAPWVYTTMEYVDEIVRSIHLLREAREKYCK
ncbi:MAG: hypothetical protein II997_09430 [Clostridia bacterium]|nr:hypothetical protein [Clostridia bacterium]